MNKTISHSVETLRVHWCKGCEDFITDINHCEICRNAFCPEDESDNEELKQPYIDIWICPECIDDENKEIENERKKNGKI